MLLLEPFYDSFRDTHEAANELSEELREHLDERALVLPLGAGSRNLAARVARRLGFESADFESAVEPGLDPARRIPRTVILVAERVRRIRAVDAAIARLLHAGVERIIVATPLAESGVAYQVDDRADVFICLRRAPRLVSISRWYDSWRMPPTDVANSNDDERLQPPVSTPLVAAF